jgi:hypothetical protein
LAAVIDAEDGNGAGIIEMKEDPPLADSQTVFARPILKPFDIAQASA